MIFYVLFHLKTFSLAMWGMESGIFCILCHYAVCKVSSHCLSGLEEELRQRLEQQEQIVMTASEEANELLKRFDELKELKQHQECQELQKVIENR